MSGLAEIVDAVAGAVAGEPRAGFALVGGFAVGARAEPRFTRDVDFAVAVANDHEAESIVRRLGTSGFAATALVEQEATGRLATARMTGEGGFIVDLLFASSGIEDEIVSGADVLEILPDLRVSVASIGHLVAMKLLAQSEQRPTDRADLDALLPVASSDDLATAFDAVDLIEERGYARGRDLRAMLTDLVGG